MTWSDTKDFIRDRVEDLNGFRRMLWASNFPRIALLLIIVLIVSGTIITYVERDQLSFSNFFASVWWVLVTITTVGYGDMVPITPVGRLLGAVIILSGVILVSTFTASVSSMFVAAKIKEGKGLQKIRFRDHLIVCGTGFIADELFSALNNLKIQQPPNIVVIADIPGTEAEELINGYNHLNLKYIRGDWTHEEVLKRAGLLEARTVIVLPDEKLTASPEADEKTILTTLTIKSICPKIRLVAHILRTESKIFLKRAHADEILVANEYTGFLLAANTIAAGVPQIIKEMLSLEGNNQLSSSEIPREFIDKSFLELSKYYLRQGSILIGLTREETPLEEADILSADMSALDEFIMRKFKEAGIDTAEKTRPNARLNPPHDTKIHVRDRAVLIADVSGER